ncbi:MAG: hypothetical protein DMF22_02870 [Verrucomicrobia bacterium]|nr:MAG: hypothetical protein DMF22_02870 [Verrucomicrobiota bacterium]
MLQIKSISWPTKTGVCRKRRIFIHRNLRPPLAEFAETLCIAAAAMTATMDPHFFASRREVVNKISALARSIYAN